MSDQRLGTAVRQVRIRRNLRQADLARLAGVSQATVSRLERGHVASLKLETIRSIAAAIDVRVDLIARWRAGDLDRLLNSRHSRLHELVARRFAALDGWLIRPEVSFAIRGERGIVDILAFHPAIGMLLVIELKTDIADLNELLGTLDRKRRLAREIARAAGLAVPESVRVSIWVVVAEGATNRRRIAAHRRMLRAALPVDGRSIAGWITNPVGPVRALSFWSDSHPETIGGDLRSIRRVAGAVRVPTRRGARTRALSVASNGRREKPARDRPAAGT